MANGNGFRFGWKKFFILSAIVFLLLILVVNSCVLIGPSSRGVKVTLGKMDYAELQPGVYFKAPFITSIKKVSIQPIEVKFTIPVSDQGAITKDNQIVGGDVKVFFKYKEGEISKALSNFGEQNIRNLVETYSTTAFKNTVGEHSIFEFAAKQTFLENKARDNLFAKVAGLPISLVSLSISNYDWNKEFDIQINETMKRAQQVKQAEQDLLIQEAQSQKQVKEAEAKSTATKLNADAEKYQVIAKAEGEKQSNILKGEGIKKYNELIATRFDVEKEIRLLEIAKIEAGRWDGRRVYENKIMPYPISLPVK